MRVWPTLSLTLLLWCGSAAGDPGANANVDPELRKTVAELTEAINQKNVETIVGLHSEGATGYFVGWIAPVSGRVEIGSSWGRFFSAADAVLVTIGWQEYAVDGDIAVLTGIRSLWYKPVDGPMSLSHSRSLWTFRKVGDQWRVISFAESPLP